MWKFLFGLAWAMTAFIVHAATQINVTQPYYYLNGDWHSESDKNPTVSPYGLIRFSSTTPVRLSAVPPRGYALDQWMLWDGFGYAGYSRLADIPSSRIIATSTDYLFTVSWDSYYSPNWNNVLFATPCFSWLKYDLVYEPNYGGLSRAYGERGLIYTNTVKVAVGDVAGRIPGWESSRRGYEVAGWSTDPEATRASFATGETVLKAGDKFNATTNGLVTLYAVWQKKPMPIELDPQGGTVTPDSITAYIDETYDLPTPTRDDYDFNGWYDAAEGGNRFTNGMTVVRTDVTKLYAQWLNNRHTVTFRFLNRFGNATNVVTTVRDGEAAPAPEMSVINAYLGHHFTQWDTAFDEVRSDLTVVAAYESNKYLVSFVANGGSGTMADQLFSYDEAKALSSCQFKRSGADFLGWAREADAAEPEFDNREIVSNLTSENEATVLLYAIWNRADVPVTLYPGEGVSVTPTSVRVAVGDTWVLPTPERTGHAFSGWYTEAAGGELIENGSVVASTSVTALYAHYAPNEYTVAFAGNGATGSMSAQAFSYDEAKALAANAFVRKGHSFLGWGWAATDEAAAFADGEIVSNLTAVADATVTLHALWSPNSYTIRFDRNGGQGSMSAQTMVYDTPATLSENAFTRGAEGTFTFLGWSTAADGAVEFKDGAFVTNLVSEGSITLYAVWENNLSDLAKAADANFELKCSTMAGQIVEIDHETGCFSESSIRIRVDTSEDEGQPHSSIEGQVSGPGTLSFWWRANSSVQGDGLHIDNNGIEYVAPVTNDWVKMSLRIDATGTTKIVWVAYWLQRYCGNDYVAWLDQITWTPDGDGPTEEDAPVIDGVTKDGDGISISISTSDTRFDYQLLGTDDLSTKGDWPVIKTVSGTGEPIAFPDLINKDEPKMFYKVRVIQRQ